MRNRWNLWVLPAEVPDEPPAGVILADRWTPSVRQQLLDGATVFFQVRGAGMKWVQDVEFGTVFWNSILMHTGQPLGISCDPAHPAFAGFPTESHLDWQWFDVLKGARAADLDKMPSGFQPVLPFIDNFAANRRLGGLFEAAVGNGRIMVCTLDLSDNLAERPAARLLRRSVLDYMGSAKFRPGPLDLPVLDYWLWWQDTWWEQKRG